MSQRNRETLALKVHRELTASELDAITGGDKATTGGTKTTTKTPPKGPYLVYTMSDILISSY
jgi:hypothetical protein